MSDDNKDFIEAGGAKRRLSVLEDFPDLRDRIYMPSLINLAATLRPNYNRLTIRDQFRDGACVGFALAAVIDQQRHSADAKAGLVSPRMLYEMAKLHDEWPGNDQNGSSLRGGLKGFFHNGVCSEQQAPYLEAQTDGWRLSLEQAQDARNTGLGAYYRLRPSIIDYHAALNEVGAIVVSALTHEGWETPRGGIIRPNRRELGGHAFAIVGYDSEGFIIQNSWGDDWGGVDDQPGIGHWSYQDWAENIVDAWVLRLAAPTPKAFDVVSVTGAKAKEVGAISGSPAPRRHEIQHHFVHLDDGKFVDTGRYATDVNTLNEMAANIRRLNLAGDLQVKHVIIFAHGGLNSARSSARRIRSLKSGFLRNGIYPIHLMWETGFTEELFDVFAQWGQRSNERVGGLGDLFDAAFEKLSRGLGRRLWREMKSGAAKSFDADGDGLRALKSLTSQLQDLDLQFHLVVHSAGALLLGGLIGKSDEIFGKGHAASSVTLLAPACNLDYYETVYKPALADGRIPLLNQYLLNDDDEQNDTVGPYGKSLLYLVSRAFDTQQVGESNPLLGLEKDVEGLSIHDSHKLLISGKKGVLCNSKTHGGFDNDARTLNAIVGQIIGRKPTQSRKFRDEEL